MPLRIYTLDGILGPEMDTRTFAALAEPTRLRVVELLREGPSSVGEIVDRLGVGQPQVSKHLRVLKDSGLASVERRAQRRIYHLEPEAFNEMSEWIESFAMLWHERLDALGSFLDAGVPRGRRTDG